MNVRDFEYISEIGRSGSILKASRALYISQPALSKFLQRIEDEAGTLLFQRVGHHLVPTFAGKECLRIANEILFLNQQLENTLSDIVHRKRGEIRFGIPLSRGSYFLSEIFPRFHAMFPEMRINIFEDSTKILLTKLRNGELNLILINVTERYDELEYNIPGHEEMVIAAPEKFGLETKAFTHERYEFPCLKPEDWKDFPFIALSEDQMSYSFAEKYMSREKISPIKVLKIRNLAQAMFAVQQGIGITICPSMPLGENYRDIKYFSLYDSDSDGRINVGIVHRKDAYVSEAEKALMKLYAESYREQKTGQKHPSIQCEKIRNNNNSYP